MIISTPRSCTRKPPKPVVKEFENRFKKYYYRNASMLREKARQRWQKANEIVKTLPPEQKQEIEKRRHKNTAKYRENHRELLMMKERIRRQRKKDQEAANQRRKEQEALIQQKKDESSAQRKKDREAVKQRRKEQEARDNAANILLSLRNAARAW